ncbi:MAG: 3-isopropylmalate dehydrogenase [Chloroflexi bacterium]|nr:3-isopropylmalate dehydrogenase [Chloroflexota bacterium]
MKFDIALLTGDGVGPEVVAQGTRVLERVGEVFGHSFTWHEGLLGGIAIDQTGTAMPDDVLPMCQACDAVILGAVGGPKWDNPNANVRPEQGLLAIRKGLGLFANLRPVKIYPMLINASPLKPEVLQGADMVVIRELTGGLYFGQPQGRFENEAGRYAVDTMTYTEEEIRRVVHVGFKLAQLRRKKLTSVDKANVLATSRLWRAIVEEIKPEYPDVELEHILVDTAAMRLVQRPTAFDVIVTENMFGDILTDEAAVLGGSMGMLPSASLSSLDPGARAADGSRLPGLYEPIHGSAPDIAGQNKANPIATILSCALLLRYSLGLPTEAAAIERAVDEVLEQGLRTVDIAGQGATEVLSTTEMGARIAALIRA